MTQATIFDLDGTLIDLPVNWEALFEKLKKIMHIENVKPLTVTVPSTDPKTRQRVFAAWDEEELAAVKNYSTNTKTMKIYHDNECKPKALVTMQGKKTVDIILKQTNLKFDVVITREDSLNREQQLQMAAEKLKVPARNILFVGDADSDAAAAQRIGCQFQKVE